MAFFILRILTNRYKKLFGEKKVFRKNNNFGEITLNVKNVV